MIVQADGIFYDVVIQRDGLLINAVGIPEQIVIDQPCTVGGGVHAYLRLSHAVVLAVQVKALLVAVADEEPDGEIPVVPVFPIPEPLPCAFVSRLYGDYHPFADSVAFRALDPCRARVVLADVHVHVVNLVYLVEVDALSFFHESRASPLLPNPAVRVHIPVARQHGRNPTRDVRQLKVICTQKR